MTVAKGNRKIKLIVFIFVVTFFIAKATRTTSPSEPYLQLIVEPPSVDFGSVDVGSTLEQILSITNSGNLTLIIGQIMGPPEPFAIVIDSCSNSVLTTNSPSVRVDSDCAIKLRFTPQAFVKYSTSLQIPYIEPTTQQWFSATVPLTGSGDIGNSARGGCLITTAARGSYLEPHVNVLRDLRDRYLLTSPFGMKFMHFYYRHSPAATEFIRQHEVLKSMARWLLTPVVYVIEFLFCENGHQQNYFLCPDPIIYLRT